MASPLIAFLAGAGTGYLKQREVEDQRQRNKEDQAFRNEQREVWRKQQAEADGLQQNLKDAGAPAQVVEGPLGDQSAGPPIPAHIAARHPAPAASTQEQAIGQKLGGQMPAPTSALNEGYVAASEGTGQAAPVRATNAQQAIGEKFGSQLPAPATPQVFRMVAPGGVNKTFNTVAEADAAAKEYASPQALNARYVAALRGAGQVDKALEMERNVLQLDEAMQARADKAWDQGLQQAAASADSLAKYFSGSQLVGGREVQAVPSADGKTVQFMAAGPDGKQTPLYQPVSSNPAEWADLLTQMSRSLSPAQRVQFMHQADQAKRQQANADRTHALQARKVEADIGHRGQTLALARERAGSAGAGGAPKIDLLYGFDTKQAMGEAYSRAAKVAQMAQEEGKPMTQQQIAEHAQEGFEAMRKAAINGNQQRIVETTVVSSLNAAKGDPQAYAAAYGKALQVAPAEQVAAWGFAAPPEVKKGEQPVKGSAPKAPEKAAPKPAPDPAASRAAYQQFLERPGHQAAADLTVPLLRAINRGN